MPPTDAETQGATPRVVVSSLTGFCLLGPLEPTAIGYVEKVDLWVKLMNGMGYTRFVTHGGDDGAILSSRLMHAHAKSIIGVHLSFLILPGVPHDVGDPADFTPEKSDLIEKNSRGPGGFEHVLINQTDLQTLVWALHDSPVGLAAWIHLRRCAWSDCNGEVETKFDKDTLLTYLSLYWFTNSFVSTALYCRASTFPKSMELVNDVNPEISVPTAVAMLPKDSLHRPRTVFAVNTDLRQ